MDHDRGSRNGSSCIRTENIEENLRTCMYKWVLETPTIMKSCTVCSIDLQMLSPTLNSGDWNGLDMYTRCRTPEFKKKLMEGIILGGRPVGRAREQLGVKRWTREAEDRKSWRRLIEEARVRFGL
jgi:hypothetical protein